MFNLPQRDKIDSAEVLASEFGGGSMGTNNDLESLTMTRNVSMMCSKLLCQVEILIHKPI